jgi:hypothetical protein
MNIIRTLTAPLKSLFAWEKADAPVDDALFLRKGHWKENLALLLAQNPMMPTAGLMTRNFYYWLPKKSYIEEGFSSFPNQLEAKGSGAFRQWMQIGFFIGITGLFWQAMQHNLSCINRYLEVDGAALDDCQVEYTRFLTRPGLFAQGVMGIASWAFLGWITQNLGDFGLRGVYSKETLVRELRQVYQDCAGGAIEAFWKAIGEKDTDKVQKIRSQAILLKQQEPFLKKRTINLLGIEDPQWEQIWGAMSIFIEEATNHNLIESKGKEHD